jgi:uncharacterized phage-associated protein
MLVDPAEALMATIMIQELERVSEESGPGSPCRSRKVPHYGRPMTASVHDVAAAIHRRLPGLPPDNLHKLLYYCQGHSLALAGRPMFTDRVVAADDGPRIDGFHAGAADTQRIDRVYANTVLYVIGRYGDLATRDLIRLTKAESPWAESPRGGEIGHEAMRHFFSTAGAPDGIDDPRLTDPEFRKGQQDHLEERRAAEAASHGG